MPADAQGSASRQVGGHYQKTYGRRQNPEVAQLRVDQLCGISQWQRQTPHIISFLPV